jgi:hypothetical protein
MEKLDNSPIGVVLMEKLDNSPIGVVLMEKLDNSPIGVVLMEKLDNSPFGVVLMEKLDNSPIGVVLMEKLDSSPIGVVLMEKLDNSPVGVVELPWYHENELTVGFASRTWHTNFSVTFSTTSRGFMFIMLTLGESGIKKCASIHIQYNGKGSPKCNIIIY